MPMAFNSVVGEILQLTFLLGAKKNGYHSKLIRLK